MIWHSLARGRHHRSCHRKKHYIVRQKQRVYPDKEKRNAEVKQVCLAILLTLYVRLVRSLIKCLTSFISAFHMLAAKDNIIIQKNATHSKNFYAHENQWIIIVYSLMATLENKAQLYRVHVHK